VPGANFPHDHDASPSTSHGKRFQVLVRGPALVPTPCHQFVVVCREPNPLGSGTRDEE